MGSEQSWYCRRTERRAEAGPWELREALLSRSRELRAILEQKKIDAERRAEDTQRRDEDADMPIERVQHLADASLKELDLAEEKLSHKHSRRKLGSHIAVGTIHIDAAHNLLLRISSTEEIMAMMPGILAIVRNHLSGNDPRRAQVEQCALSADPIDNAKREMILDAVGVARETSIRENMRVRSFVNIVSWVTVYLTVGAVLVAVLGALFEDAVPLCFTPPTMTSPFYTVVCPVGMDPKPDAGEDVNDSAAATTTAADYLVVEIVGLVAAGIAAAAALRHIVGTSTPYNVPVVLALLKLPTGALTAVLGLVLMRGNFIPGLSDLDSTPQIIGWAALLGYSQQLFTRLVDNQAQTVLNAVHGSNSIPPPPPPPPLEPRPAQPDHMTTQPVTQNHPESK